MKVPYFVVVLSKSTYEPASATAVEYTLIVKTEPVVLIDVSQFFVPIPPTMVIM